MLAAVLKLSVGFLSWLWDVAVESRSVQLHYCFVSYIAGAVCMFALY